MADAPQFGMFVRSVPGHVVQRYGSLELIGATRRPLTKAQKLDDVPAIEWNDSIVPLTRDYCRRYAKELRSHLLLKELTQATQEDWEAQQAAAAKRIDEASAAAEVVAVAEVSVEDEPKARSAGKRK